MMRYFRFATAAALALAASSPSPAQDEMTDEEAEQLTRNVERALTFQTGTVTIGANIATINLPAGARFLGPSDARFILEDQWGNMPDPMVLGLVVPPDNTMPFGWAIVVSYEDTGHIDDSDAREIDYDELAAQMREDSRASSEEMRKQGYSGVEFLGFSGSPYYDEATHKLHWAKRLQFDDSQTPTLNYDIRILGRSGVLVLTAVAEDSMYTEVAAGCQSILAGTGLSPGYRYDEFDPSIDKVAAYGIGGLIAGKILAKAGILKLLLKPLIIVGVIVLGVLGKVFAGGRAAKKSEPQPAYLPGGYPSKHRTQ